MAKARAQAITQLGHIDVEYFMVLATNYNPILLDGWDVVAYNVRIPPLVHNKE